MAERKPEMSERTSWLLRLEFAFLCVAQVVLIGWSLASLF
jgi:hypothetical protein